MALLDRPHLHNRAPDEDYSWMVEAHDHRFRIHTRAYTDNAVFDAEMERIFKQTWVYVAHTSEIDRTGRLPHELYRRPARDRQPLR